VQDYLGLDNSARMNFPSTIGTNWRWRLTPGQLSDELQQYVFDMTRRFGRLNPILKKEEEERIAAEEAAKKAAEEEAEETLDTAADEEV